MSTTATIPGHPGPFIRAWMEHAGHSQSSLARTIGTKQGYISQIISEKKRPSVVTIVRIALACGWAVEEARGMAADYDPDVHGPARTASLPPDASSIDSPGWNCLRGITARSAAVARTLVPEPPPALKVA